MHVWHLLVPWLDVQLEEEIILRAVIEEEFLKNACQSAKESCRSHPNVFHMQAILFSVLNKELEIFPGLLKAFMQQVLLTIASR